MASKFRRRGYVAGQLLVVAAFAAVLLFSMQQLIGSCTARRSKAPAAGNAGYLAMCLIVKDQSRDIIEWIEHHRNLGAGKFYIWDHNSTTSSLVSKLYPHLAAGLVSYHYFREFEHPSHWAQSYVYDKCLELYGHKHKFMAFIDTDEFIVPRGNDRGRPLPDVLREYEDYGALVINERLLGSSGHVDRPPGGALENYWACLPLSHPESLHVKTIANTRYAAAAGADPHHFTYAAGRFAVTEHYKRVDGARSAVATQDRMAIYHYATRSAADFADKMARGAAHGLIAKSMVFFDQVDAAATDMCEDALSFAEEWRAGYRQLAGPGVDIEALLGAGPALPAAPDEKEIAEEAPEEDQEPAAGSDIADGESVVTRDANSEAGWPEGSLARPRVVGEQRHMEEGKNPPNLPGQADSEEQRAAGGRLAARLGAAQAARDDWDARLQAAERTAFR